MREGTPLVALVALLGCQEAPLTDEAVRGRALVDEHGCGTCHVIPEVPGADGLTGPPLTAMREQAYVAGVLPNTKDALARFIAAPRQVDPRSAMPDLGLDEEQAAAIAAFLYEAGDDG